MTPLLEALSAIARDLDREGARWALVGGLAVSARTEPRFTRDLDVAVAVPDDGAAERLARALLGRGYTVEWELTGPSGRLVGMRLVAPPRGEEAEEVVLDLLFASSGIEDQVVAAATPLPFLPGLSVPVAALGHLLALKLLSAHPDRRPQDLVDLRNLVRAASAGELARARAAAQEIQARGFHRGKDLPAELELALARHRVP